MSRLNLDVPPEDVSIIESIMEAHGFSQLKPTQKRAFEDGVLDSGNHLLVAETGNGKTLCAEAVSKKTVQNSGCVAYLVPSKQLVRDKKESIEEWTNKVVSTAPNGYYDADIVVATFDSFYQALLNQTGIVPSISTVILDDFHELYGSFRGPAIEKTIGAIKESEMSVFAMSATLGNPDELGDWLNARVTVSKEGRQIDIIENVVEYTTQSKKKVIANFVSENTSKSPFLVFNYAKSWVESRAEAIADEQPFGKTEKTFIDSLEKKVDGELTDKLETLGRLLRYKVAFHHSDLPRNVKEWVEDLYYNGDIKCLCSTTTIAYGFDAPVKSVIVGDIRRGPEPVGVWEYTQWIGRAARPGYGYDEGYAYTVTKNAEEVADRYFAPRELEPVTTHFEADESFNKLLLELITNSWRTPEELQRFIEQLLYWVQMNTQNVWGEKASKSDMLQQRLKQSLQWLQSFGFIREQHTSSEFQPTTLGEATVEFLFSTFSSYKLQNIKQFYTWITDTDSPTHLETLAEVCTTFDISLANSISGSKELESELLKHNLDINKYTKTAAIVHFYWAQNYHLSDIERTANIEDATNLKPVAKNLAETLEASRVLFEATPTQTKPKNFNNYIYRIKRGIREDEYFLVKNVSNLGRKRIRSIRTYLMDSDIPALSELDSQNSTFLEYLEKLYESAGKDKFKDVLRGQYGIGKKTAENIASLVENESFSQTITRDKASHSIEEGDKTRGSTLDEF